MHRIMQELGNLSASLPHKCLFGVMKSMIKAVIFDIGNVLTDFSWKEMYREKGLSGETFERVAKATV